MRSVLSVAAVALALTLASCGDSPTLPRLGATYTLVTMDGVPVPAAYDSVSWKDGSNRFFRVVGRSLEFFSRDSASYAHATDIVERLPGGELRSWALECTSQRVAYRRQDHRVILTIDPNVFLPVGSPRQPLRYDTVEVAGSTLQQWKREQPTVRYPQGRSWRLEYRDGTPSTPVCRS